MTQERALATVEEISELRLIENADSIMIARVRGWDVIVRIADGFQVGDLVVYFEIDSFLPLDDPRFTFLAPRGARKNQEGVEGHVLKTAKMRGVYSQGLIMPYADFEDDIMRVGQGLATLGMDITAGIPGLEKWDPPIPAELAGSAKGAFPGFIRKTDEERVQNMPYVFDSFPELDGGWIATEKIDGSSMTVYINHGEVGVASRNWDLEETSYNSMWKLAHELGMIDWLKYHYSGDHTAVFQGEIFGPGIQGNPLDQKKVQFRLFNMFVNGDEVHRSWWPENGTDDDFYVEHVPLHLGLTYPQSIEEALAQVENLPSKINPQRPVEGIVWRNTRDSAFPNGARASWKAISQRYLMKHDR
jgi:RNA ligase (TIGR02306 family)